MADILIIQLMVNIIYRENVNWFSGFIGGELWNLYDLTKNEELKTRAISHADALIELCKY